MIDVECTCGRVYTVPEDKAGKKLQCRRCGSVSRIPSADAGATGDAGVLIPFQTPGMTPAPQAPPAPLDFLEPEPAATPAASGLNLAEPARRCPSCGFMDDAAVVVCVRCGYDWRTGKRLKDVHENAERSDRVRATRTSTSVVGELDRQATLALSPLGLFLGPYVLFQAASVPAANLRRGEAKRLGSLRWKALGGFALWALVLVGVLAVVKKRGKGAERSNDVVCAARLKRSHAALLRLLEGAGSLPDPPGSLRSLLETHSDRDTRLSPNDLRCPLAGDLYAYRGRVDESLSSGVAPNYLVLWDREPHTAATDSGAPTATYRALRFDGEVEAFGSEEALNEGVARPRYVALAGVDPGAKPGQGTKTGKRPTPTTAAPNAGTAERQLRDFATLAAECERRDPLFSKGLEVPNEVFVARVGVPTRDLLPVLCQAKDPALRLSALRMTYRSKLNNETKRAIAREFGRAKDVPTRFALSMLRAQIKERWLQEMLLVMEAGDESHRAAARDQLGKEALSGRGGTRRVLETAQGLRPQFGVAGDDAVITLPAAALPDVAHFLGDRTLAAEAAAVLYSAGKDGVEPLKQAIEKALSPAVRSVAMSVAWRFALDGAIPMADYLALVQREKEPDVQAAALEPIVSATLAPDATVLAWTLEVLRKSPAPVLETRCREILERVGTTPAPASPGTLAMLVADLGAEGNHRVVLSELARDARRKDPALDALALEAWESIPDPEARRRLIDILEKRKFSGAVEAIVACFDDPDEATRIHALKGLKRSVGPLPDTLRRDAARSLARRVKAETSVAARRRLFEIAKDYYLCGRYPSADRPARHTCNGPLITALKTRARAGDRTALGCIAEHPSDQALDALLSLLPSAKGKMLSEIRRHLNDMTGLGDLSGDVNAWRTAIRKSSKAVETRFRRRANRERTKLLDRNNKAAR